MSNIALVVQFTVRPEHRADFLELMDAHAARSLVESDGCLRFDVLTPKEARFDAPTHEPDETSVLLFELYRDEAALQAHLESDRVARTREGYAPMIESRRITRCVVHGT